MAVAPPIATSADDPPDPAAPPPDPDATVQKSSFLWKNLFSDNVTAPLSSSPTFLSDGTPVVRAPTSVLLNASQAWIGHLLCHFLGNPPSPAKIFADLNPVWGRKGAITVRRFSEGTCLVFVPSASMRRWILDAGLWSSGMVSFTVSEWSPTASLAPSKLTSAPVILTFRDVPPQLWSQRGVETIAGGVATLIPKARASLPLVSLGTAKLRAIVPLGPVLPPSVVVEDENGDTVRIGVEYGRLPPLCSTCRSFCHSSHRCLTKKQKALISETPPVSNANQTHASTSSLPSPPPHSSDPSLKSGEDLSVLGGDTSMPQNPNFDLGRDSHQPTPPLQSVHQDSSPLSPPANSSQVNSLLMSVNPTHSLGLDKPISPQPNPTPILSDPSSIKPLSPNHPSNPPPPPNPSHSTANPPDASSSLPPPDRRLDSSPTTEQSSVVDVSVPPVTSELSFTTSPSPLPSSTHLSLVAQIQSDLSTALATPRPSVPQNSHIYFSTPSTTSPPPSMSDSPPSVSFCDFYNEVINSVNENNAITQAKEVKTKYGKDALPSVPATQTQDNTTATIFSKKKKGDRPNRLPSNIDEAKEYLRNLGST